MSFWQDTRPAARLPRKARLFTLATALVAALGIGAIDSRVVRLDPSTITSAEIDRAVTRLMAAANVPGVGIAIFNNRKVAYLKAFGVRDVEKKLPLTPNSVMTAASYSKSTFAYMVMQLVQSGVLNLDTPIQEYLPKPLPEYSSYNDLEGDERYKRITARMLLSHTAGFPNLRILNKGKLNINFEPGSRYAYSGEGVRLLQFVVETITNTPVNELMRDGIFKPFDMTRTSMVWESAFERDHANGYDERGRSLGPQRRSRADTAGSMQTTLADFSRFIEGVMHRFSLDCVATSYNLPHTCACRNRPSPLSHSLIWFQLAKVWLTGTWKIIHSHWSCIQTELKQPAS